MVKGMVWIMERVRSNKYEGEASAARAEAGVASDT